MPLGLSSLTGLSDHIVSGVTFALPWSSLPIRISGRRKPPLVLITRDRQRRFNLFITVLDVPSRPDLVFFNSWAMGEQSADSSNYVAVDPMSGLCRVSASFR